MTWIRNFFVSAVVSFISWAWPISLTTSVTEIDF